MDSVESLSPVKNEAPPKPKRNHRQERRERLEQVVNQDETPAEDTDDNNQKKEEVRPKSKEKKKDSSKDKKRKSRSGERGHRNKGFSSQEEEAIERPRTHHQTKIQKVLKDLREDVIEIKGSDLTLAHLNEASIFPFANAYMNQKPFQRVDLDNSAHKMNFFNRNKGVFGRDEKGKDSGEDLTRGNRRNVAFLGTFTALDSLTQIICYILVGFLLWLNIFGIGSLNERNGALSHLCVYIYNTLLSIFVILIVFGFLNRIDTLGKVGFGRLLLHLLPCLFLLISHFLLKALELQLIECRMYNSASDEDKKFIHLTHSDCKETGDEARTIFNKHPALALTSSIMATLSALCISLTLHSSRERDMDNFLTRFKVGN